MAGCKLAAKLPSSTLHAGLLSYVGFSVALSPLHLPIHLHQLTHASFCRQPYRARQQKQLTRPVKSVARAWDARQYHAWRCCWQSSDHCQGQQLHISCSEAQRPAHSKVGKSRHRCRSQQPLEGVQLTLSLVRHEAEAVQGSRSRPARLVKIGADQLNRTSDTAQGCQLVTLWLSRTEQP